MIELKNITYKTADKVILDNVSLKFDNEISIITGPNGAGKSTLVKIIMGIIKQTSGQIFYKGEDISNLSITERAKLGFSFAFQTPVKFKGLKVHDVLRLANRDENTTIANQLANVGLCANDYLSRELGGELSGGEHKRIEIASVLARKTDVVIFDEPEAGIDLWSFEHLIETFKKYQEKNKSVFIMISHQKQMLDFADKVIVLKNGKLESVSKNKNVADILNGCENCKTCEGCGV